MILRSLTKHVKEQNWFAVVLDFLIVVIGIFVGFQVTEWNTERSNRLEEALILDRLISEYQENLVLLDDSSEHSTRTAKATLHILSLIAPEPDPSINDKSISAALDDMLSNPKFYPTLGHTDSLIASGDIRLIRSSKIQSLLSQWKIGVQRLVEWQEIERMHGEELILGVTLDYLAWPSIDFIAQENGPQKSKLTSDYQGLFSSKRFEGLLTNRYYNQTASVERIEQLKHETNTLIDLLRLRRQELN